ncbi:MAG TPA: RNB domain-containing ribonuclease [Nocardioides sp.]|uniref:RNB domain-containing ribonuclease n=1 Tax=uncultured Nocardioides sp. TaxID=198441 RepID=UPI000EBF1B7C|nr:RNB domain-containing ribonuclease [uncultured Nocardioides sp.]HCB03671.1 ribonuclease II [Nocardioides sp.]HRD63432.1 RNB domain-containing ribonuclease [Nocardioides sp.]HRI97346.1 RNB domain-containing ribonuclease [Nocardioides sp.]HRK47508.1 RNB domain-containing ribonuclease [Nocardioides sp.]
MSSSRVVRVHRGADGATPQALREGIAEIQRELEVTPDFPADVEAAAERAVANPRLPDLDRTDLPFVTIDPAGSTDLDQALHLARTDAGGYVLHYAIADLAAFITPGDAVDLEAHRRGQTLYGADSRIPLHPTVISEGGGSLLPDQLRPALLWSITMDGEGARTDAHVERAMVRSRAQLDYTGAQRQIDDGTADESLLLLKEVGELRLKREQARGGVSLPLPEQEIDTSGEEWQLTYRQLLPVEEWNAQLSLLTGFAAASIMMDARVGFLRTLPPPDRRDIQRLHRTAHAHGIDWPTELPYPDFIRTLDPAKPQHAAMITACTRVLRGSGYVAFDGETPAQPMHSALNAEYAHVTAPLRRLGDRYASEVCVALCAGVEVPAWVRSGLTGLAREMQVSSQRASRYERLVLDLVEAGLLQHRVGESFAGVIVEVAEKDPTRGIVTVAEPAVEAPVVAASELPLGTDVRVRLTTADPSQRKVEFTLE